MISGPVWIDKTGPRTGPCLAETVQKGSRARFLVLFRNRFLVLFGNRTLLKCTFYTLRGEFILKTYKTEDNIEVKGKWQFLKLSKVTFQSFNSSSWSSHSIQTGTGTSLCSCSGFSLPSRPHSLFLLKIPKQDQQSLFAPCPYCLCQAGASSWSVGKIQTQDYYT